MTFVSYIHIVCDNCFAEDFIFNKITNTLHTRSICIMSRGRRSVGGGEGKKPAAIIVSDAAESGVGREGGGGQLR